MLDSHPCQPDPRAWVLSLLSPPNVGVYRASSQCLAGLRWACGCTPTSFHHLHSSFAPVHNALPMQVLQSTADLRGVENSPCLWEASLAHVVDVEFKVTSIHQRQHQAQRVLGLIGIGQAHLWPWGPEPSGRGHRPPGGGAGASHPKNPQYHF